MDTVTIPLQETWNLQDLYPDDDAFRAAGSALRSRLPELERWRGAACESSSDLADCLEALTEMHQDFARLRCYATLGSDQDSRDADGQAARQEIELLATELSDRTSYLRPELLAAGSDRLDEFLDEEPRLEPHAFFIRDLLRQRAHVLGPAEERILAQTGLLTRAAPAMFEILHNVDLPRPEIALSTGESVRLTPVEFVRRRNSPVREDRAAVLEAYFGAYANFRDTFAQNLYSAVKSHMFRARVRGYDSSLVAALDPDHVPVAVYRNLIAQVRRQLPVLHRFLKLRANALGVERMELHDLYCPIGAAPKDGYDTHRARELVTTSASPVGERYVEALTRAFDERWIDWHPRPGKRAGAYATGWAYAVHPYVLTNFTGDHESVSTLAHEMGHAMHSYFSNRAQPFATADYSIFVAEVASTLNETLLDARTFESAGDEGERLFLLGSYLDGIRGTLFRQTMFAEFELEIHERAERGDALTGERLDEIYLKLLRDYHGHDEGVLHVDERYAVEWMAIPHFYYNFYVYQYATGILAATALSRALLDGRAGADERYLRFLSSGGSDHPLELLRTAGVDLERSEPYDDAFAAISRRIDLLEALSGTGAV